MAAAPRASSTCRPGSTTEVASSDVRRQRASFPDVRRQRAPGHTELLPTRSSCSSDAPDVVSGWLPQLLDARTTATAACSGARGAPQPGSTRRRPKPSHPNLRARRRRSRRRVALRAAATASRLSWPLRSASRYEQPSKERNL
ncbi:unnamed protein product [Urochloa humidicola]